MRLKAAAWAGIAGALAAVAPMAAGSGLWLNVPYVRQQKDGCGAAVIAMVMQYWAEALNRKPNPASNPRTILEALYDPRAKGIYASAMAGYLRSHGFSVYSFRGTWRDLEHQISKGRPLIVALKLGRSSGPNHYVVVAGLTRMMVMVNDPARRKLLKLDRRGFENAWKAMGNWTLLAVPR